MFSELGIILLLAISVIGALPCGGIQYAYVCHPRDPTLYQLCIGDTHRTMKCPAGLYFSKRLQKCNWLKNADCYISKTSVPRTAIPTALAMTSTMNHISHLHSNSTDESPHSLSAGFSTNGLSPSLNPSSQQVHKHPIDETSTFISPKTSPVAVPKPGTCNSENCKLPNCRCAGTDIPGGLPASQTPMMVMLTFDDSVNYQNFHFYSQLFHRNLRNPNGCPFKATFFVSGDAPEFHVNTLYKMGMEIASHSQTHRFPNTWWADAGYDNYVYEIEGMRKRLSNTSNIPYSDIKGMRVPFLQLGGDDQYQMLHDYNYLYDSSMAIGTGKKLWPFTLDWAPDIETCSILPCPQKSFPGLWEVPLELWNGSRSTTCSMADECEIELGRQGVRRYLNDNFNLHYTTNRSPLGIFVHASWFTRKAGSFEGLVDFLQTVSRIDDVWVMSMSQVLDWVRNPVPTSQVNYSSWQC